MSPSVQQPRLQDLDDELLASLARRLLPDPTSETPQESLSQLPSHQFAALEMLTQKAGVTIPSLAGYGPERTKVLDLINDLLTKGTLTKDRAAAAAERLGARGDLRLTRYALSFANDFKALSELGARPAHVQNALAFPDKVQHILPEDLGATDFPAITLLAKRIVPSKGAPFVTLIEAQRIGAELVARSAWRVPDDIVLENGSGSLLDLLQRFVDRFGLPMKIGPLEPTKFIAYKSFPFDTGTDPKAAIQIAGPTGHSAIGRTLLRVNSKGFVEVALAYTIDKSAYQGYWRG